MITIVPFTPSVNTIFSFQPTLGGTQYNLYVTWNLAGQRWYLNIADLNQNLVLAEALVGSPDDYDLNLIMGYISGSSLVFRTSSQSFEVSP